MATTVSAARLCLVSATAAVRRRTAVTLAVAAAAQAASTAAAAAAASSIPPQQKNARIVVESDYDPVPIPDETLPQFLWRVSKEFAHHPCITCGTSGRSFTFSDVHSLSRRWALALAGRMNLKQGDVVALLLPNVPEYVPTVQGALLAGLRVTMANPLYTAEELRRQFTDAGARAVVTVAALAAKARESVGSGTSVVVLEAAGEQGAALPEGAISWERLLEEASEAHASALPSHNPDSVAALPYSSGTTGLPKGVMLTHRNLVANLSQVAHPELRNAQTTTDTCQEVALTVLPFFHIYGFNGVLNTSITFGMQTVSMPVFRPEEFIRCLVKYKPTTLFVVPSLLQFMAVEPAVTREMLSSLHSIVSGAAPATQALIDKFLDKAGNGVAIRQGYGMTESSPVTLMTANNAARSKEAAVGKLIPNTRARVLRPDGNDAGVRETGELLLSGPQIMKGYLGNEKATQETIDEEGWLHTGDVVYYDEDHYFYIVDRTKELIKVKGNQVSPTELENLIMELPQVADCAVVGIPDPRTEETPRAFVVLKPDTTLTAEQICKHIEPKVIKYKRLNGGVVFLDTIPRNPSGKIQRHVLRDWKSE